ncbi:hypothetical protein [Actinomadura algeriensis]|uniref:RanBP2-type domain-containing protein n=1 Tax=Actinomadura algeriensis TaxID=1679523 RepID=A0ABR9JLM9_9ACTN|nr:hypothetical protein [Actinomadura algeriensis]MBE1531455.1 hypothetical protein [Actinomadura algeriensis]
MRCRWCNNDNIVTRPQCTHCGEEMPEPRDFPDDEVREAAPDESEPSPVVESWKSVGVALVMFAALVTGGKFTVSHWPVPIDWGTDDPVPSASAAPPTGGPLDGGVSPEPTPGITVWDLLTEIQNTRSKMPDTLGDCVTVESDLPPLREVTEERRTQAGQAANADFTGLANADELRDALVEMTRLVLEADERYIEWAERATASTGLCTPATSDTSVMDANTAAADAKQRFVELWNAATASQGGPTYVWNDF